ncbi:MAG: hypothetical protein M3N50_02465 [Pseudomonadota bacterium]|nr:hypothetical protein [Pseudomonadota bacterium]
MDDKQLREEFDTGLRKIRHEIKSRLVPHGLFGTVTNVDSGPDAAAVPEGSRIEIHAMGRTVGQTFDRQQIEGCRLRVSGAVLAGIIAMVDEVSALPHSG